MAKAANTEIELAADALFATDEDFKRERNRSSLIMMTSLAGGDVTFFVRSPRARLAEAGIKFDPSREPDDASDVWLWWTVIDRCEKAQAMLHRGNRSLAHYSNIGRKGGKSRMCKRHPGQSITICGCPSQQEEMHKRNAKLMHSIPTVGARAERIAAALGLKPKYVKNQVSSRKQRARYSRFYPKPIR